MKFCASKSDACDVLQLGARKSALGATKVSANFEDLEREAVMAEKLKMEVGRRPEERVGVGRPLRPRLCSQAMAESAATLESVEAEVASLRLAYRERDARDGARASRDRLGIAAANRAGSR